METFQKEVLFISKVYDKAEGETAPSFKEKEVARIATFKDLTRTDKAQHKLHFAIIDAVGKFIPDQAEGEDIEEGAKVKLEIKPDILYDITVKFIKNMLQVEAGSQIFSDTDRQEFVNDSGSIYVFGMWLLTEKLFPFFANFRPTTPTP